MLAYSLALAALMGAAGVLAFLVSRRLGVPRVLVLLLAGLALGNTPFLSRLYDVAPLQDQLGAIVQGALIIVLFYGGLSIDVPSLKPVLAPAIRLATVGALGTALLVGLALYGLHAAGWAALPGFGLLLALTFGALIAPNDPIAVFSTIDSLSEGRGGTGRAETIAKIESGFDDTVVTTLVVMIFLPMLQSGADPLGQVGPAALPLLWLIVSAVVLGAAAGYGAAWLHRWLPLDGIGQVLLSLALVALLFLLAAALSSSGYVAVFCLGLALSRLLPAHSAIYRPLSTAWGMTFRLCEVFAFVTLGALVRLPVLFSTVLVPALVATAAIVLVARPLQVLTCTAGAGLSWGQKAYVASVAMKGLDPAVLAIAVVAGVGGYDYLIDLTFAVVVGVTIAQGPVLVTLTRLGVLHPQARANATKPG